MNSNNVGRFQILASKCVSLQAGSNISIPYSVDLPLNHHIRFNGATATDLQKGGLFVVALSDLSVGSANKPTFFGWTRLTYYDN